MRARVAEKGGGRRTKYNEQCNTVWQREGKAKGVELGLHRRVAVHRYRK